MSWLMLEGRCDNREEHDGHGIDVWVKTLCVGATHCGEKTHEPHEFDELRRQWCPGVCDCGIRRGDHGPGEHK